MAIYPIRASFCPELYRKHHRISPNFKPGPSSVSGKAAADDWERFPLQFAEFWAELRAKSYRKITECSLAGCQVSGSLWLGGWLGGRRLRGYTCMAELGRIVDENAF